MRRPLPTRLGRVRGGSADPLDPAPHPRGWFAAGCRVATVGGVLLAFGGLLSSGQHASAAPVTWHRQTCSQTTSPWNPFVRCTARSTPTLPEPSPSAVAARNPLAARPFYIVPGNPAQQAQTQHPSDATELATIASQPTAMWITEQTDLSRVGTYSRDAAAKNELPTFVLYAIPHRDCGSYSAGGFSSPPEYVDFVNAVRAEIGDRKTVVIVEPDALPELWSCGLTPPEQAQRLELIRYAGRTLSSASVHVYLEAGGRYSGTASAIAPVLRQAGIDATAGFALNVSAYDTTKEEVAYGTRLSALVGGKHFVVDTSRNGRGVPPGTPTGSFCNVPGLGLGTAPTTETRSPLADAYLWVKYPGESDGACGHGAPTSGVFWLSYALKLVQNARS